MSVFIEVVVEGIAGDPVEERQDIEEQLERLLGSLGTVEGGGTGLDVCTIDIEIGQERDLEAIVALVRGVLVERKLSGVVVRYQPTEMRWTLNYRS